MRTIDGGRFVTTVTPVLDTSIYADGDVMFIAQEITNAFGTAGDKRILDSIVALDGDDQNVAFDLVFGEATFALGTINAGVTISDADAAKILGYVSLATSDAKDLINSRLFVKTGIGLIMQGLTSSLWIAGISRGGTPTYTATGMKIKLGFR